MAARRTVFLASLLLAGLLPLTATAQQVPTVRPGPDAAQIVGSPGFPNRDLFSVVFLEINGVNLAQPRDVMWLEPGTYQIRVRINALHTRPHTLVGRSSRDEPGHNVIELELEAGKQYYILGRFNREDRETPYSVILHQVKEPS
jgi:hypothetical protein